MIFVGFNEFPSFSRVLVHTVIHQYRLQGPTLIIQRVRWDFACAQCDVCTDMGPPVLSPIQEDLVM